MNLLVMKRTRDVVDGVVVKLEVNFQKRKKKVERLEIDDVSRLPVVQEVVRKKVEDGLKMKVVSCGVEVDVAYFEIERESQLHSLRMNFENEIVE